MARRLFRSGSLAAVIAPVVVIALVALAALSALSGPQLTSAQSDTSAITDGTIAAAQSAAFVAGDALVVNTDALNLRAEPATTGEVLAVLETGAVVTVTGDPTTADGYDWYPVDTDAGSGYVAGEFLATTVTVDTSLGIAIGDGLVVDTGALNLRADATTDADVLATLAAGDAVTIIDGPVGADGYTWYQVDTAAGTGWVAGEYLAATVSTGTDLGFVAGDSLVVDTDALNVRDDATVDAGIVATLATGDPVTITDGPFFADGYTWYAVDTDLGSGYVAGEYLAGTTTLSTDGSLGIGTAVFVDTDALNLRADATLDADVIVVLAAGETGTVVDGPVSADGYTWYAVDTVYGTGWVAGQYLGLA